MRLITIALVNSGHTAPLHFASDLHFCQYGLPDLQIFHEDQGPQSVEEKFSFYIGATSQAKMDLLTFWRVSI